MTVLTGKTFHGENFELEEVVFIDCKLKNCHLFYSGGDYEWANSTFESCHFHFRGPAKKTQELFQQIGLLQTTGQQPAQTAKIIQ